METMVDKIIRANSIFNFFSKYDEITVALSGGADSVALLYALNSLKQKYGFKLYAAHYNHGIRGKEALRDQNFAKDFCEKLSVPFFTENGDVPSVAKEKGISIELAAREARYDFLSRVSNGKIATAHTASDNIETIIFNLARGTSLDGIKGIPAKRDNIIRPLILCSREDVEKYCDENKLSFVIDSTNLVDDCSRNVIRHKIVPILKEINASCIENASKMSLLLNEDSKYINDKAYKEFSKRFLDEKLFLKDIDKLEIPIAKRVVSIYSKKALDLSLDYFHINELYDVCLGKIKKTSISKNVCGEKSGEYLVFTETDVSEIIFETKTDIVSIEEFKNNRKIHEMFLNCAIDYDMIVGKLRLVERDSHSKLKLANSNSTKTIKKLLTEKKVPIKYRKNLPILADDNGIVWAYKIGTADRVKVNNKTKTVLYVKIKEIGENKNYGNN